MHIPQLGICMNVVGAFQVAKYAQILKNSVASKETAGERVFLMKDRAAVEVSDSGECRLLIMFPLYGIFKNSANTS